MAKPKKSTRSAGPHKNHGPKKKMFHCWDSTSRLFFGRSGILKKEYNREAFNQSMTAKGIKPIPEWLFIEYTQLTNNTDRKAWMKGLSNRNISKEDTDKKEAAAKKAKEKAQKRQAKYNVNSSLKTIV